MLCYVTHVGVGKMFGSVCMFVCLSVIYQSDCSQHNSKTNDPKVFKLGIGNDLGYPRNDIVFRFQCHSCYGYGRAKRRGFKLYECLLVACFCVDNGGWIIIL